MSVPDKHTSLFLLSLFTIFIFKIIFQVKNSTGKIWLSKYTRYFLATAVPESRRILKLTPIALMKAIKNPVEVQGMKNAHVRDAAAVCCFFGWLQNALKNGEVVTEVSAADKLEEFRK